MISKLQCRATLLVLLLTCLAYPLTVRAETSPQFRPLQVFGLKQQDLDGDGTPDLTSITCAIESPQDRVLVLDGGNNMRQASSWSEATDFTDDTWIFHVGAEANSERATLIIAFSRDGDDTLARIYDKSLAADGIQYSIDGHYITFRQPPSPSMIIRAKGDWQLPDGTLNYNLQWQYDGPAADRGQAARLSSYFALDGHPEMIGESSDRERDGIPEYLWVTLQAAVPLSEGFPRTGIKVNSGAQRPEPWGNAIFWPLLNQPSNPQGRNYFDTPLFLGIDWKQGLISSFSFFGYPVESGYHINSLSPMVTGQVNPLRFENPMAYYDLADDRDGLPELFIRMAYTPSGDPFLINGSVTRTPMQMVQYSWNQLDHPSLIWDYKVDLAGRNPLNRSVTLGSMVIEQVPHAELPAWVMDQPWGFATFVALESEGYLSSEGIYEWSTLEGTQTYTDTSPTAQAASRTIVQDIPLSDQRQRTYLNGDSTQSPSNLYRSIIPGYRGEFADINGPIMLYFSPLDARLHLLGAQHGVYNAGRGRQVKYRNLRGGATIDSWQLYVGKRAVAQLLQADDALIYATPDQLWLRKVAVPLELFRTQPPSNHAEWLALSARLAAERRAIAPDNLVAMFQQFSGPELRLRHVRMSDYRPLAGGGFRFVLELLPNFAQQGDDFLGVAGLTAGHYVVRYDGQFHVTPITPPVVQATLQPVTLHQLQSGAVAILLRNDGLQDLPAVTLELWAAVPQGAATLVATRTIDLLAQLPVTATLEWTPPTPGVWHLTTQIRSADQVSVSAAIPVLVGAAPSAAPLALLASSSVLATLPFALIGLVLILALAGGISGGLWRASADPEAKHEC